MSDHLTEKIIIEQKLDNKVLYITLSISWIVQEMEISQWEEPDLIFSKLTFHMNKTFKTCSKSLHLPYANEANFDPVKLWSKPIVRDH